MPVSIIAAAVLAVLFGVVSYALRLLSLSGALAAAVLGAVVLGWGGWAWIIPLLTFFVSSSLLSKVRKNRIGELEEARGSQRGAVQVLANGGLAGIIVLLQRYAGMDLYPVFLGVLAAVNADTWSTEIGVMLGKYPRNIITGKPVSAGASGGVTLMGLLGAFLGAGLIAGVGGLVVSASLPVLSRQAGTLTPLLQPVGPASLPVIILAGFAGSVFDSLLGATLQEKRRCLVCGKTTEKPVHCAHSTERIGGIPGLNNDVVNFLCGALGGLVAFA